MLEFILKFSACLSIFMVFYKLVLERANMHQFKRFYLLGVVVISAIIPLITFTEYIEPQFIMGSFLNPIDEAILFPMTEEIIETPIDYTPIIIWSLYGLGVLVFSIKFALNLKQIILKIKNNLIEYPTHNYSGITTCAKACFKVSPFALASPEESPKERRNCRAPAKPLHNPII